MDGISSPNVPLASALDEVLGNQTEDGISRTRRQTIADHALQIAASEPMLDAFAEETAAREAAIAALTANVDETTTALDGRVDDVEALALSGIKPAKQSVRLLVTTATDPATMTAGSALDGLVLAANDRVARATPAGAAADGVYVVQAAGSALRSTDMDAADELVGARFDVDAGTHASETWSLQTPGPIVVGTTALTFAKTTSASATTAEVLAARGTFGSLGARENTQDTRLDTLDVKSAQLTAVYHLGTGTTVYRATYPTVNNAPASTFEAGGVVAIPIGGVPQFDVMLTATERALLIAGVCDLAIVSAGGAVIPSATYEQYNGAAIIGAGTAMTRVGNDFIASGVALNAAVTKIRFKPVNTAGAGVAKIYYPEVRLVAAADVPAVATLDHKALAVAETSALSALPVNIAAGGPYSMRRLAGAGAAPVYNSATGEITLAADTQSEIVFINGPNIRAGDTVYANMKVVTDDTLAGFSGIFAIPVQGVVHSTGPGVVAELTKMADNLYYHAVFAGNDGDGNAPGSIVLRPDTRASGLKAAKQVVISDIWISSGNSRPAEEGLTSALRTLRDAVTPASVTIDTAEDEAVELSRARSSNLARKNATFFVAANGSDAAAGGAETAFATLDHALDQLTPSSVATITIANPGVVTWANHGLVENDVVVFSTTNTLPTGLVAGTKYYVTELNLTANTFSLAAIKDGPPVITSGAQVGVHTATKGGGGKSIGMYADAGNVNFRVNAYRTIVDVDTLSIGGLPATMDGRQHLTGAWALVTGTSYLKAGVTFRENTVNAGVLTATWDYMVWDGERQLTWIVGGADIAANRALVDATPYSFEIHRTGSAVQDPRDDISSNTYDIYVNRGSDPTGADISTADLAIVAQFIGGTNSCRIIGAAWKDFAKSSSTDTIPTLENYVADNCKQHGWVGPAIFTGKRAEVNGFPSPGVSGVTFGRAGGYCINLYTATYRDIDLVYPCDVLDLNDNGVGLGGHGSGNQGYRSLDVPGLLRGRNLSNAVGFAQASVILPFFKYGARIGRVDLDDVDEAFVPGGSLDIRRGGTVRLSNRSLNNGGSRTGLIKFMTSGEVFKATDLDIYSKDERGRDKGGSKYLFWRGFAGNVAPTLWLRGCQDISPAGRKLSAFGSAASAFAANIILESSDNRPTIIGDLVNLYVAAGYLPASITVGAGTTFGFAGMTRTAMRAFFDANLVPHSISNATTIVGPWGEIVELPA